MALQFVIPRGAQVIDLTRDDDRTAASKSSTRVPVRGAIRFLKKAIKKLNGRMAGMDKKFEDEIMALKIALPLTSETSHQSGSVRSPITNSSDDPVHPEAGATDCSPSIAVPVDITKAAGTDVSPMEYIDTSASADATVISARTPIAPIHDVDTQSRTEIATEQIFIRRSKRVMKRPAEAGNDESLAAGSKRAKR